MKVSVVVPIWNSRKYIETCISSLKAQIFKDFEVIFVIDSKTDDGSEKEIANIGKLDVKVATQTDDGRVSSARNMGQAMASGEYVWFYDVDDLPSPFFLERMVNMIESTDSDFVACNFIYHHANTRIPRVDKEFHQKEYDGLSALAAMNRGEISPNVWDKLFRTSTIRENGIMFANGYSEDYHFVSEMCIKSSKVAYTTEPLYYYNINNNSRSAKRGNDIATKDVEIFERYRAFFKEEYPDLYEGFCRDSMEHIIRSFTMTDWKTCKELMKRESVTTSIRYCSMSNKEFLLFRISPRIYHMLGKHARNRRYKAKSFLFNPDF